MGHDNAILAANVFRYGSGKENAAKLQPLPHDQDEKDAFWLSPPRYTTVIPVIAKADSMTIDEKWECQRALAVALRKKKTIKWVNLRQQFPPGNPAALVSYALLRAVVLFDMLLHFSLASTRDGTWEASLRSRYTQM